MKNVFLIEDHDEALGVWRCKGFKDLDLVHVDAHMDYNVHPARPLEAVLEEAASVKDLKKKLEYTLAFQHYQQDLGRQTDIGNYIYSAMGEGIVRDFTWVIPGALGDFARVVPAVKDTLRAAARAKNRKAGLVFSFPRPGFLSTLLDGRAFSVCVPEALPQTSAPVLLDIDTDFLVVSNILTAGNTQKIGQRQQWIETKKLTDILSSRIGRPACITIAYSTRGGWTPMLFRYLGDELAYQWAPGHFAKRYARHKRAANYFNGFSRNGSCRDYQDAVRLDARLGSWDNNLGPLYLETGRFQRAEEEFRNVLKADARHAGALWGMGVCEERRKNLKAARRFFERAWQIAEKRGIFKRHQKGIFFSLASVAFRLNKWEWAAQMFLVCCEHEPLDPRPRFFLGCLAQKERAFETAAAYYRQAIQLGLDDERPILGLLKIVKNLEKDNDIIKYVRQKVAVLRRHFLVLARKAKKKPVPGLRRMGKVLRRLEKKIEVFNKSWNQRGEFGHS